MQAKKKPIEELVLSADQVDMKPHNKVIKVEDPAPRKAGITVDSVDTLIAKLKTEAAVI